MTAASIHLLWLPVGAGGHVVVHTSRWWELLQAAREHRRPLPLFHTALDVEVDGDRTVVEMAPAWGAGSGSRGVVATGPVGLESLGRCRLFRYEVRRRSDGVLPDRAEAVGAGVRFTVAPADARALLDRVPRVPRFVWGRDPLRCADMWNSNSLVAWLLAGAGLDLRDVVPPGGGRAPGWRAGLVAASAGHDVPR